MALFNQKEFLQKQNKANWLLVEASGHGFEGIPVLSAKYLVLKLSI